MALPHFNHHTIHSRSEFEDYENQYKLNKNMKNKQEVVNSLVDAITASGQKFSEISKDAIFAFLKKEGLPNNTWEDIYKKISEVYNPKIEQRTEDRKHMSTVVDYSNNSHNDVKVRQPRKSVFEPITKIAG